MAKKGKKKDPEKKFALQAAKEAKADKKAQKRLQKEARREQDDNSDDDSDNDNEQSSQKNNLTKTNKHDDDIDALLEAYQKQSLELSTPLIEILGGSPDGTSTGNSNSNSNSNQHTFPYPPRGNFTLTLCPTSNDIYMFGGEYFNGVENVVFDELLCWNPDAKPDTEDLEEKKEHLKGIWKRIIPPVRPPARCSHTTVYYNHALYVFGGELATAENYHHYKDIWKFDLAKNLWTEMKPNNKGGPTSRSGHRSLVWRHYMVVYGGFYEAVRESPRWFNDLHIYDFSTNAWIECKYSTLATTPPERSAFNFGILGGADVAYLSGGYSKLKNPAPGSKAEGRVFTDCWALHLRGLENGKTPTWERLSRKGEYPSTRSGTACGVWKNKMLVYGGVEDEETENHRVKSVFFDDLFALDMDRKRWFRLNLKKKAGDRRRRKKDGDRENEQEQDKQAVEEDSDEDDTGVDGEATSSGWDLGMLKSNMFAFIDGDGNVVYEKIDDDDDEVGGQTKKESETNDTYETDTGYDADAGEKESSSNTEESRIKKDSALAKIGKDIVQKMVAPGPAAALPTIADSEVMVLGDDGAPIAVSRKTPLPRIKAQIVVRGNTLYVYGGILEVGDREVTLDDLWSLELQKREEWVCIHPGSMHKQVWKGVESDNESYISTDRGIGGDESDDEDDFYEFDDIIEEGEDDEAVKAARKAAKKALKKEKMQGVREEIKSLNEKLNVDDSNSTPQNGEELADFYSRTSVHWTQKGSGPLDAGISQTDELTAKELKREGFNLARDINRYDELKQVLARLNELESTPQESEERKEKKKSKKDKKDKDKDKDKKKDRRR